MSESNVSERIGHHWSARPVLFVSDVQAALCFYIEKLGFKKKWDIDHVCQVDRGGCEIILCADPARQDKSRLFVELNRDGMDDAFHGTVIFATRSPVDRVSSLGIERPIEDDG